MKKLENLELVGVEYQNNNQKAVLTFLDEEHGEIREVNFNKQSYDNGNFVDDPEKAEKVEGWCKEYFDLPFDELTKAIGEKRTVYAYDKFNSLFEVAVTEKFGKDMVGQILNVEITDVIDDGIAIRIKFEYDGKTYETKMSYSDYLESRNEWFVNPQKKRKRYDQFKSKFGVDVEDGKSLIGRDAMVEVKLAFGKFVYNDMKPLPKSKK